jgi:hypothetical protein
VKKTIQSLQEFSIPLIAGVIMAMIWANISPDSYQALVHTPIYLLGTIFNHGADHGHHHPGSGDDVGQAPLHQGVLVFEGLAQGGLQLGRLSVVD